MCIQPFYQKSPSSNDLKLKNLKKKKDLIITENFSMSTEKGKKNKMI